MPDEAISRSAARTMLILALATVAFWTFVAIEIVI